MTKRIGTALLATLLAACGSGGSTPHDGGMDLGGGSDAGIDMGGGTDGGAMCMSMETICGTTCVKLATDVNNCGSCGHACASGETCTAGSCMAPSCTSPLTMCTGGCTDTSTDRTNCGSCGHACASGESCVSSACTADCAAPNMVCTEDDGMGHTTMVCRMVQTDAANCGTCGHACNPDQTCVGGSCQCASGRMDCSGTCVNTDGDPANCGSCGHACNADQNCVGGACTCPTGRMDCGGSSCVNTMIDNANCGSCGHACGSTEACAGGTCTSVCAGSPGTTPCGPSSTCVSTMTDNNNCGGCGNVCATNATCMAGLCVPTNDQRSGAIAISLATAAEQTITGSNANGTSTGDGDSACSCDARHAVWYSFTVGGSGEVVYFDTFGSGFDTELAIANSTGTFLTGDCNDDASCTGTGEIGTESQVAAYLGAGSYLLEVDGCSTGTFTLHVQHFPRSATSYLYTTPITGTANTSTTLVGTSAATPMCTIGNSGEDARWFLTCTDTATQTFSLCAPDGGSWTKTAMGYDPVMYIWAGQSATQVQCNDDGGFGCGATDDATSTYGSRFSSVTVGRGLNVEYVDERTHANGLAYTLHYAVTR